jgi:hypothetical protein
MSILLPNYALPPPALEPRSRRAYAIFEHQVIEQSGALNIVLLALIFLVVILPLVVIIYIHRLLPAGIIGGTSLATFYGPIGQGVWYFLLILLVSSVGAGSIARDAATKAMTLYLARPIRPIDYLAAKSSAVAFWILIGGVLPGCIGTIIVLAIGYVSLPLALQAVAGYLAVGVFSIAAFTGVAVLLSSLTPRSTLAGAGIFGILLGSDVVTEVLSGISGKAGFLYASPVQDVLSVAAGVFDASGNSLDPWSSAAVLVLFAVAALGLSYARLRRTQEVAE